MLKQPGACTKPWLSIPTNQCECRYISEDFGGLALHPVDLLDAATGGRAQALCDLRFVCIGIVNFVLLGIATHSGTLCSPSTTAADAHVCLPTRAITAAQHTGTGRPPPPPG